MLPILQYEIGEQNEAQTWQQPGIQVSADVGYLRSLARSHAALLPGDDQFDTKLAPGQWLGRGVTEVYRKLKPKQARQPGTTTAKDAAVFRG